MAVVKVVPFPGAPGATGPQGPSGPQGESGIVSASQPLVYDQETGNISLNQEGFDHIGSIDYLQYDTNPAITVGGGLPGQTAWDAYHETIRIGVGHGATLDLGQEFQIPVYNISGDDIYKGTVVMAELDNNGSIMTVEGGKFRVTKAITNGTFQSNVMLGIAITDIFNGNGGLITTHGHVHDVNIDSWELGDILWADPAIPGGLTSVQPSAPNLKLPIATITYVGQNNIGTMFVRMTQGSGLGETDHNVQIDNPLDGDILAYDASTGVWRNVRP